MCVVSTAHPHFDRKTGDLYNVMGCVELPNGEHLLPRATYIPYVLRNAAREPSNQFTNPEDAQDILDKIEFGAQFYNDNPSDFRLRYYHMTSITENYIVLPFNSIVIDLAPMIAGVLTEKRPLSEVKLIISY